MIKDLRFHGEIGPVDFSAYVGGQSFDGTYFYEETPSQIRFFSKGNEFTISNDGVYYKGAGGSFCEYMFGVEKPLTDMVKPDVSNRLITFGAFLDTNEKITFTNDTEGRESFDKIFLQGNAVKNYYFIVSSEFKGEIKKRQQQILKLLGKFLKRTKLIHGDDDSELMENFVLELNESKSSVFIFKLIHKENYEFYKIFETFYLNNKTLTSKEQLILDDIAARYMIDSYQQERMKIDVMYRNLDNKAVVDEYRDILLNSLSKDSLKQSEISRLGRLRTLSIRNNIPSILFDTLDDLLLKGKKIHETKEPEYLKEARAILGTLFFKEPSLKKHITNEDIIRLLKAKHKAFSQSEKGFEQILLDTGKTCDDLARETGDFSIFEEFSSIVTYFDRYDNTQSILSQLAFMEHVDFTEDSLRSLIGNKKHFDRLDPTLFDNVIITGLLQNKYITSYGRKKITALSKGITKISVSELSIKDVVSEIKAIKDEAKLYHLIRDAMKDRMRSFYPRLNTKEGRTEIRTDIENEVSKLGFPKRIPQRLFEKALFDLKKESFYINHLLPIIIEKKDISLREDFIKNSGLDRFYIEMVEKEHFEGKGIESSFFEPFVENNDTLNISL
ncbi:MAG: TIGR04442 family protein [Nitrospiraceae bacterium]|nr:TIGR04442 family protein [Nitrospiraceae bacterium]